MATASPPVATLEAPDVAPSATRRSLDWFEVLMLVAFAAASLWVLALNLYYAHRHGLVWTGSDGVYPGDQLQYMAWIRDASHHVLVSDLFVPWPTPHDYLQPLVAISGGLVALGMAPWLALILWKPVAVLALFFAVRAYCHRTLAGRWERRGALALALFGASWGALGDEWLPFISWGYVFALLGVAALMGALLYYDRGRLSWQAPALGLLASWLNPWEGELVLLVVVGAELVRLRRSGWLELKHRLAMPAVTLVATALPLLYYGALGRLDKEWRVGRAVVAGNWPLGGVLLPLIPLLLAAALAYTRRPRGFLQTATMVWPVATLVAWAVNQTSLGAWSLHSWTGITIPLAVLAVQGARNVDFSRLPGARWLGVAAVAALTIPVTVAMAYNAHKLARPSTHHQNLISKSEDRAFRYLASNHQPGVVLTDYWDAVAIPAYTGRRVYADGIRYWSEPRAVQRANAARRLLEGPYWWKPPSWWYTGAGARLSHARFTARQARTFVQGSGVRFVLQNCGSTTDLQRWLAPISRAVHRFGCATLYQIY